ncbi:MAG: inositol monophosphatase family protein [Gammaproteobacteria bacterium]
MQAQLNIALQAGRKAAEFIHQNIDRLEQHQIEQKGANDFVTLIDKKAEKIITDTLLKAFPEHHILAEESGALNTKSNSDFQWIIDPLDGTTNFIFGVPHFAVSIALLHKGRLEVGVVIDAAKRDEFTARRGGGATLNGRRIRVRNSQSLANTLLATGIPFGNKVHDERTEHYFIDLKKLASEAAGIRRMGAAALDLAYVAAGRFDGYWESGVQIWDVAAGALLVQEAGGLVSDYHGGQQFLKSQNIVAGSPKVFKGILSCVGSSTSTC